MLPQTQTELHKIESITFKYLSTVAHVSMDTFDLYTFELI